MNKPYRPGPRYVAGDPYQMIAAMAITQFDYSERQPKRRRRNKHS